MAKICIVLATYNGEKYLAKMLDSLVGQTRPADFIVAVDDGSKDSTVDILKSYQDRLPLQITVSPKNEGHRAAFSKALSLAKPQLLNTDLVALADQDDVWLPNKLEILEQKIGDASLIFGDAEVIDHKGNIIAASWRTHSNISTEVSIKSRISGTNNVTGCTAVFKAKLIDAVLPIPEHIKVHDVWIALLAQKHSGIKAISEPVIQYRIHESNAIGMSYSLPMSQTLQKNIDFAGDILANTDRLNFSDDEIKFTKKYRAFLQHTQNSWLNIRYFFWLVSNRNNLFPEKKFAQVFKKILFSSCGFKLAKIIFSKS